MQCYTDDCMTNVSRGIHKRHVYLCDLSFVSLLLLIISAVDSLEQPQMILNAVTKSQ